MRNAYESDLDRMEAAYRRDADNWVLVHALLIFGLLGVGGIGFAVRSSLALGLGGLAVNGLFVLGLLAVLWRRRRRGISALSRPTTMLGDAISSTERDVVLRGHLETLDDDRGWLVRCPDSPGVVGWIDTIELEAWRANERGSWLRIGDDRVPRRAEVVVAATASLCEHPPDTLLDRLALGGYREPPRVVRLTGGRRAPVRLGVLPSTPIEPPLDAPKVRVAVDADDGSEADAEGRDVERGVRVLGQ